MLYVFVHEMIQMIFVNNMAQLSQQFTLSVDEMNDSTLEQAISLKKNLNTFDKLPLLSSFNSKIYSVPFST